VGPSGIQWDPEIRCAEAMVTSLIWQVDAVPNKQKIAQLKLEKAELMERLHESESKMTELTQVHA
jgi:hypothetical protein